ncbi:MAG: hypothetical protein VB079_05615 [Petrimonas sp.]|nr:hypothetical protein [Petrimonas sp.]
MCQYPVKQSYPRSAPTVKSEPLFPIPQGVVAGIPALPLFEICPHPPHKTGLLRRVALKPQFQLPLSGPTPLLREKNPGRQQPRC